MIRDGDRILLAKRPDHVDQGGLWEFPGGKREAGEAPRQALARELHEELGIVVRNARPLIRFTHRYPDKTVELDVWEVTAFDGIACGREGQPLRWVAPDDLRRVALPAANRAIVTAARLPDRYLITGAFTDRADFLRRLERALAAGIRLVQLRAHGLEEADYLRLADAALARCHAADARLLLNAPADWVTRVGADGVHLTRWRLAAMSRRPLPEACLVAASVHDPQELSRAEALGVDFSVLSPVTPTRSHPQARPLGWARFGQWVAAARHPVYALGGLGADAVTRAREAGAQGVAAIGAFWG